MDFSLSSEQKMLQDALERVAQDASRHRPEASAASSRGAAWREIVDMGLTAMPFAEADGGLGGGPVDTMLVMQALGKALVHSPWWSSTILAGGLLADGAGPAQRQRWLPEIIDGSRCWAFAHVEPGVTHAQHVVTTTATLEGGDWTLRGRKCLVPFGGAADRFVVSARTSGLAHERSGFDLFVLDADAPGLRCERYASFDGAFAADLSFDGVRVHAEDRLDGATSGWALLEPVYDRANAALCADAFGAMETMLSLTLAHVQIRCQFGAPLSALQSVQHDVADMYMELELARSMVYLATCHCTSADAQMRRTAVSGAKAFICRASRRVGELAIQLHGGIGMTDEYPLGAAFRRCAAMAMQLGDAAWHTARLTRDGGFAEPQPRA